MTWRNDDDFRRQRREHDEERYRVVVVKVVIIHETAAAFLVIEKDVLEEATRTRASIARLKQWVPKSQIKTTSIPLSQLDKDDEVDFGVPAWLAQEKGFLYE